MTDARRRDVERRTWQSPSLEDVAASLRERARVDVEFSARLDLAAFCGHPAAVQALGEEACVELAAYLGDSGAVNIMLGESERAEDLRAWLRALHRWGERAQRIAWLAVARALLNRLEARFAGAASPRSIVDIVTASLAQDATSLSREEWRVVAIADVALSAGDARLLGGDLGDPLWVWTWTSAHAAACRGHSDAGFDGLVEALPRLQLSVRRLHEEISGALRAWAVTG